MFWFIILALGKGATREFIAGKFNIRRLSAVLVVHLPNIPAFHGEMFP